MKFNQIKKMLDQIIKMRNKIFKNLDLNFEDNNNEKNNI